MPPGSQPRKAYAPQLKLPKAELGRLANRIQEDFRNALSDHDARMARFTRYYMAWRNRTEPAALGEEEASNYHVPLTQWHVYTKLAKETASLFGADAEVVAKPTGPSDQRIVKKVGCYETWRLFSSMAIVNPAITFNFRKILFGRAHVYMPWMRDTFQVPLEGGGEHEEVYYEGPGFMPLWPDDLIVPAEDVDTIQDFSFAIRRYRATPDELLRGDGVLYQGIEQNFQDIVNLASHKRQRDPETERLKTEKDAAEGVIYEGNLSAGNCLVVLEWYGKWRMLKSRRDARTDNLEGRERFERELVVRYQPDLHLILGVQDLAQMYPKMRFRRPFGEASLVKDGSYWGPGFGELLEYIEQELTVNHNLATEAGEFSVGPVIFYRPASGFDPDSFEYEPKKAVACEDPNGVKVVSIHADLSYPIAKEQTMQGYAERVTGQSDMNMGRAVDRPNAPRTARQTLALLEEGDVRASLDLTALREDWGAIIDRIWLLDSEYAPEKVFFRVTEERANGLFDVAKGGAFMTAQERGGRYDFELKFATNVWSRETNKQNQLALYQLDLQNPLVVQNPRALWVVLDKVHRAFGDDQFGQIVPEPPDLGLPVKPSEEETRALQGEELLANPMDNDQLHLIEHNRAIQEMREDPERDEQAYRILVKHALEHVDQMRQKQLMAALTSKLVENLAANTATGRGLMAGAPPTNLVDLQNTVGEMIAGAQAPMQQPAQPAGGPRSESPVQPA